MKKETVGFNFQVIQMQEARSMLAAGWGLYSELKEELLARIPQLQEGQSFVFGMPNGKKLDKGEISSIRASVNKTFIQAGVPWKIGYSVKRNLFIGDYVPGNQIANKAKSAYKKPQMIASPGIALPKDRIDQFVAFAKGLHPEIDLTQRKGGSRGTALFRSAICQVGVNFLGIKAKYLAPFVGISIEGVTYNAKHRNFNKYVRELENAVKENRQ